MDDREPLQQYVHSGSREAFGQLVSRHLALVHAAARRQTGDPATGDDVTQAVFIVLARRAANIKADYLPGWLLKTAHYASRAASQRNSIFPRLNDIWMAHSIACENRTAPRSRFIIWRTGRLARSPARLGSANARPAGAPIAPWRSCAGVLRP